MGRQFRPFIKRRYSGANLEELLLEAFMAGYDFAPSLVEKSPRVVTSQMRQHDKRLQRLMDNDAVLVKAAKAMFMFSLADAILINQEDEIWLRMTAVRYAAMAQGHLMQTIAWLGEKDRYRLAALKGLPHEHEMRWQAGYRGAFACTALAKAMAYYDIPVRIPRVDYDVHDGIDLFCEPRDAQLPDMGVQVKSKVGAGAFAIKVIRNERETVTGNSRPLKDLRRLWNGVQGFNEATNSKFVPVFCQINKPDFLPVSLEQVELVRGVQDLIDLLLGLDSKFGGLAMTS